MGLFGKKNEEEYEDDEEFEKEPNDDFENRKLKKQLRDLKSENKKARKEPPKPWGKRERLTVLIVMVITILISGSLYLSSRPNLQFTINNLQINTQNFKVPNFDFSSFNIFKEGTIIIEKHE